MKRPTPLQRRTPLKRNKTPIQRKAPLHSKGGLQRQAGGLHAVRKRKRTIKLEAPRNFPHMGRVKELGCIICRHQGLGWTAAEAHHIHRDSRTGRKLGASMRAPDEDTIPLCDDHHTDGGLGVAFHAGSTTWERENGNELELLAETNRDLGLAPSLPMAG